MAFEARRQNACPTPPAPCSASQTGEAFEAPPPGVVPPLPLAPGVVPTPFAQFQFTAVPVDSRRPMSDVTGPQKPTVPMPHSASRSAHGVVHWPRKTFPNPPWMPIAELRDAGLTAWLDERSSGAFCSICTHALNPPPRLSLLRTP